MNMSSPELHSGFRFHPADQELIIHYLKKKVSSSSYLEVSIIADVDIYKFNPWELPGKALFGENEWGFFSLRDRKYSNGVRPNRAAGSGYWKTTGTDKPILTSNGSQCLGVKNARVPAGFSGGRCEQVFWMIGFYAEFARKVTRNKMGRVFAAALAASLHLLASGAYEVKKSNTCKDYYYDLHPCLMAPPERKEAGERFEFQEVSPGCPISGVDSKSQPTMVSTVKERLEYIKKMLKSGIDSRPAKLTG